MKRRITVKIHPAGMVYFGIAFLLADSHLVVAATAALLIHEAGHLVAMQLVGMKECLIELTPFGGVASVKHFDSYRPVKRLAASCAGIAASLIAAVLGICLASYTPFWKSFVQANFSLGLFNFLPAWPLDGARAITALAAFAGYEQRVKRVMSYASFLLGAFFGILALYGVWCGSINFSLLVMGPYLCYASRMENAYERARNMERINQKWTRKSSYPVSFLAVRADAVQEQSLSILAHGSGDKIRVMMAVDPASGKIVGCTTEYEILKRALDRQISE